MAWKFVFLPGKAGGWLLGIVLKYSCKEESLMMLQKLTGASLISLPAHHFFVSSYFPR